MSSISHSPVIDPVPSLTTRLSLYARTWLFKAVISTFFSASAILVPSVYRKYSPTYIKRYPIRPMLECRVFIPKTYTPGTSLPLYIDIHGGGFFAGTPQLDDKYCHYICNKFNYVVVSIEYRLAPSHPFPVPVDDCTELALAVFDDIDLPVDRKKVVVGGQSAGGNLALVISQDERLRSKVKALVVFYPATDFSHKFSGDYRDKPADENGKGAIADGLRNIVPLAEWSYVPFGHDKTDPRLSPMYADPKSFPARIYFIAAQYDKLCEEAFMLAARLAKSDTVKEDEDWDLHGIRWERLPNEVHGFVEAGWRDELFGSTRLQWKSEVDDVLDRVGEWTNQAFREH